MKKKKAMTNKLLSVPGGWVSEAALSQKMILETSEGTIYGARYYTVQPMRWGLMGNPNQWNDMVEWTVETFGPTPEDGVWTPSARWYVNNAKFWFRERKDLEWFLLRWQ
jgi:hypothetical protein